VALVAANDAIIAFFFSSSFFGSLTVTGITRRPDLGPHARMTSERAASAESKP